MKALVINGSPHMDRGGTALILGPFLDGMRAAGTEVELVYTRNLTVNPCGAEWNCLIKNPGRCHLDDDMNELYPKLREADVLVLATPVHTIGMSAPLKNVLDRMVPLMQPYFELNAGHCCHPPVEGARRAKVVLVANCGFWEMDNFDPLVAQVKAMCRDSLREYAGALLRPHGPTLAMMLQAGAPVGDVLDAARGAGRQLVETGGMSVETLAAVSRPLIPLEAYVQNSNQGLRQLLVASHR